MTRFRLPSWNSCDNNTKLILQKSLVKTEVFMGTSQTKTSCIDRVLWQSWGGNNNDSYVTLYVPHVLAQWNISQFSLRRTTSEQPTTLVSLVLAFPLCSRQKEIVQRNRNEGRRRNLGIIGQETIASRVHDYEKFLQKVTQNLMADLHKYF